jgi:ankyrin repeat protein
VKRRILAVFCVVAATAPVWAQTKPDSLANLIEAGNRKAALDQIRAGADVNEAQPDGTRPIQWAVYRADYELLDALIAKKARVDVTNEFGSTPLAEAVKLADARMVKTLLDAGAGPESPNQDGETALMLAIKTGELPIVQMLIKAGADVNVIEKFHNQTPLMYAAAATRNAGDMVKLLLSKGANVKPRALYTDWPSQITSEPRAQYRPVGGLTALLYAARSGCYDCVEALIGAGADVNEPTPEGVTPLMTALDSRYNDVAKLLLDRGANPQVWDWWGRTALYIVIDRKEAAAGGGGRGGGRGGRGGFGRGGGAPLAPRDSGPPVSSMDMITTLLAANVDPNPQLNMHRPSRGGNSGRFVENQLSTGCTPLFRAAQGNDMEVVRALLAKGANPNINTMGLTAFLVAAGVGPGSRGGTGLAAQGAVGGAANMALMDELLQHGANVNAQVTGTQTYSMRVSRAPSSNEGMTALHVAAQAGRADLVRYLLDKGASPELVDADGQKAIDLLGGALAGSGTRGGGAPPPAAVGNPAAATTPPAGTPPAAGGRGPAAGRGTAGAFPPPGAGGRGGRGAGAVNPATAAEIRALLEDAASKK